MSTIKIIELESNSFKTISIRKEDVQKKWFLVDASEQTLGRMCSKIAKILRGKHKASFTPHVDCGDNVVVINASKINLTGNKWSDKKYISYTGYPGGQRIKTAQQVYDKNPSIIIEKAIKVKKVFLCEIIVFMIVATGTFHGQPHKGFGGGDSSVRNIFHSIFLFNYPALLGNHMVTVKTCS